VERSKKSKLLYKSGAIMRAEAGPRGAKIHEQQATAAPGIIHSRAAQSHLGHRAEEGPAVQ